MARIIANRGHEGRSPLAGPGYHGAVRISLILLLFAGSVAADEADEFFELGLSYLKTAFYAEARSAFAESLVRAPGQAVPTAFAAIASAAEGRDSRSCAYLLRLAYQRLPARRALRMDLRKMFRSAEDLRRVEARIQQRHDRGRGRVRDNLTILAFLQAHDGGPETSPALDTLLQRYPDDAFGQALKKLRPKPPELKRPPTKKKTPSAKKGKGKGPGKGKKEQPKG